ncbi:MAG: FtsX-like permease family protein [Acidobacteria bacterium]|nr:FtsX-like permease family protein [Acidobacteriota bacterium]MYJ03971.1 FtsX-like permease family protein [Acidobacteriota bacterium]
MLRRALRSLVRRRTFTVTVVLTLALAFSVPAIVLSTVSRHFWRPPDLVDSDRLFTVQIQVDDGSFSPLSHAEYLQLRGVEPAAFSLATFGQFDFTLVAGGTPTRVNVALVSANFFSVLGGRPAQGRLLAPTDDGPGGGAAVAVVSRRVWTTQFGRDPDIVGRAVRLGPQAFTVVGVAANPLSGPAHEPDFWVPLPALQQLLPSSAELLLSPPARWLSTVGRLGTSTSQRDVAILAALARDRLPADVAAARTEDWRFVVRPVNHVRLGPEYHRAASRLLTVLMLLTSVFLFGACSNLVLLLLTRDAEQAHELAVRRALGASGLDLISPLAIELLVLVGGGALAGLLALRWVGGVISALPQLAPLGTAAGADAGVVLWLLTVAASSWAVMCLGLLLMTAVRPPALIGAHGPQATRRGGRQRILVAAQVAVSAVLIVAAGLLLRSAHGVASIPHGFVAQDVVTARIHPPGPSGSEGLDVYRRLLDAIERGGVVTSAALAWHTPLSVFFLSVSVEVPGTSMDVPGNIVSAGFFRTLGVPVLEGREFNDADQPDAPPVAMVNRTLASRLWPGSSAVGRTLAFPRSGGDRTVVGVVDDMRYRTLAESTQPLAYLPLEQRFMSPVFIHVRSPADADSVVRHLRQAVASVDPGVPVSDTGTLRDRVDEALSRWRTPALLAGVLALITLVLVMGGLYGVLMLAVRQRTRELAIRRALGAREESVRWLVLSQGLRVVAAGTLVGLGAGVPLMGLLGSQLYGIAPHDFMTVGASMIGLFVAGGLACDLPARRAARLDTAAALRTE